MSALTLTRSLGARAEVALHAIARLADEDYSAPEALDKIVDQIVGVIGADAVLAGTTDPHSGLGLGAELTRGFADGASRRFWEHELLVPDYTKFADLILADPVADLRQATGDKLDRSARHRAVNALTGLEDELRAILPAGGRSWGRLQLSRRTGRTPFTASERAFLRSAARLAGAALRRTVLFKAVHADLTRAPGVVVLDRSGTMISATAEAEEWLTELAAARRTDAPTTDIHPELLLTSLSTLSEPAAPARWVRLRTADGSWLIAHASPLVAFAQVVLVIEPAKASQVAPIILEAYRLTSREVEVARLVATGRGTDEIASAMFLSPHTVRDHLKAIFEKLGARSRAEMTSKLFAEAHH